MKRIFIVPTIVALLFCLTACSSGNIADIPPFDDSTTIHSGDDTADSTNSTDSSDTPGGNSGLTQYVPKAPEIVVYPGLYDFIDDFSEGFAAVVLDGKAGFIDASGNELVPPKYAGASAFSEGVAVVFTEDFKFGFIDTTGNEIVPPKYEFVDGIFEQLPAFSEGIATVMSNGVWGFVDTSGYETVPPKYTQIYRIGDNKAWVREPGSLDWIVIDTQGNEITHISKQYQLMGRFTEGRAVFSENGLQGIIDTSGNEIMPAKYDRVEILSNGFARVQLEFEGKWGVADSSGKEIVPPKYDRINDYSEGFAVVTTGSWEDGNEKYGYIDTSGNEIVPPKYTSANNFSNGFAAVGTGSPQASPEDTTNRMKYGFIDTSGNEAVLVKYDWVWDFSEGYAVYRLDRECGFIDTALNETPIAFNGVMPVYGNPDGLTVQDSFFEVYEYSEGLVKVSFYGGSGPYSGIIDTSGNLLMPLYNSRIARVYPEGFATYWQDMKQGLIKLIFD